MDKCSFLTTYERSRSVTYLNIKTEIRTEYILPQQPVFTCLGNSNFQSLYGQRIFCPDINQSFRRTNGITANCHCLNYGVRITFHDGAIHKSTGIPFIGITHHIFHVGFLLIGKLPLQSGRETTTAASAKSGTFYHVNHFLRLFMEQTICQCHIAIQCNIFLNVFGIDKTTVTQSDAHLLPIEIHVLGVTDGLLRLRIDVEQPFYLPSPDNMLSDYLVGIIRNHLGIESVIRDNLYDRSLFTKAETTGSDNVHLVGNIISLECLLKTFSNNVAVGCLATCTATNQNLQMLGSQCQPTALLRNCLIAFFA